MRGERRYKVTVQRAYEVFAKNELEAGTNAKSFASGQWASKIPTQILAAPKKAPIQPPKPIDEWCVVKVEEIVP